MLSPYGQINFVTKTEKLSDGSAVAKEDLLHCFRYPVSSGTNEEGALRLLSRFPYPEQVRAIRDPGITQTSKFGSVVHFVNGTYASNPDGGSSLLHYACSNGWYDVSRKLVEQYHCDVHLRNGWSNTPLDCACKENGNIDLVRFLIVEQHCDPTCLDQCWDRTPLHYACESGKPDIVRFIVEECNCDPRVQDKANTTLLSCACRSGKLDIVRFLVEEGHCDPREQDYCKLHCACGKNGSLDVVRFLVVDQHWDPAPCSRSGTGRTPLHTACESGKLDIVKFLVKECHCDPRVQDNHNYTPLHYACKSGKLDIVRFLVEECDCDPFRMTGGYTPLHLATRGSDHHDLVAFLLSCIPPLNLVTRNSLMKSEKCKHVQLLQVFKRCRTQYSLDATFKIFVLGNHAAGKSTLVKIIENEITSLFGSFAGQWRNISKDDVEPLTAGIIPVSIESSRLGQIVIYDMAGQYQYYSSHAVLLRNLVSSSASMFLVVVSLNQSKEDIVRQLQYWNSFVANCYTSAGKPPTVAVFSHADEVTEEKPEGKSSDAMKALMHSETSSGFSEVVTLDCRKLASGGLTRISKIVAGCCAKFKQTFHVDFAVHLLYAFISSRLAGEIMCTVSELQSLIRQEQGEDSFALKVRVFPYKRFGEKREIEILPTNTAELSQHLTTLSDKGQFLFLRNAEKVEDSWVVINKAVLLSEVNGTIFAPKNFKQYHKIANSTGVVPFSKVREVFPKRDPDLVVAFLQHLEFCQEISESEVSLITTRHFRCSCGPMERFFFFPALVNEERLGDASAAIETPSYRCGWILQCSQPHQFLTPQFLHVLLLRLAFSFALAPDNTPEVQPSPVLERRCCVWKNGICWLNRKGVETTVEVTEQNTVVSLTISCLTGREMECVKHRSQVIKCILEAKEELSPVITMKESLIHPGCLTPPTSLSLLQLYSLSELAEALVEEESVLVSQPGKTMVEVEQLLHFEPYTCFSVEMLRLLFVEENSEEIVSEAFVDVVSKTAHTKLEHLKCVFSIDSIKLQRDQPEYQCKQMFQVWKESTQTPTYRSLRSVLDEYSVFCGRNPLELAGCLPETTVAVVPSEQPPPVSPPTHHSPPAGDTPPPTQHSLPAGETPLPTQHSLPAGDTPPPAHHSPPAGDTPPPAHHSPPAGDTPPPAHHSPPAGDTPPPAHHSPPAGDTPPPAHHSPPTGDTPPPTHHSPPAGDTHKCGQPTLIELVRFRGRERRINVPQEVSTKYTQFGILLLEDTNGDRVRNMEHKHRGDVEQINMEILREWVSGRGKQPVSWATLTEVLRDVELSVLARDIEEVTLLSDLKLSDSDA